MQDRLRMNCGLFPTPRGTLFDVPLYACDRCGFASTAFRADAARSHQLDYPLCAGTIRMVLDPQTREWHLPAPRLTAAAEPRVRPSGPDVAPPSGRRLAPGA